MTWRLKNKDEFKMDGWTLQASGDIYYPDNSAYSIDVSLTHLTYAQKLTQEEILQILQRGTAKYHGCTWSAEMFTDYSADMKYTKCGCRWARHPLYCKCPA